MTGRPGAVRGTALLLGTALLVTGLTGCGLRERGGAADDPSGTAGVEQPAVPADDGAAGSDDAAPGAGSSDGGAAPAATADPADPADPAAGAGVSASDVAAVESLVGAAADTVAAGEAAVASDG